MVMGGDFVKHIIKAKQELIVAYQHKLPMIKGFIQGTR